LGRKVRNFTHLLYEKINLLWTNKFFIEKKIFSVLWKHEFLSKEVFTITVCLKISKNWLEIRIRRPRKPLAKLYTKSLFTKNNFFSLKSDLFRYRITGAVILFRNFEHFGTNSIPKWIPCDSGIPWALNFTDISGIAESVPSRNEFLPIPESVPLNSRICVPKLDGTPSNSV